MLPMKCIRSFLLTLVIGWLSLPCLLGQQYTYKVDLNKVTKDQLTISLQVPDLKQETLLFQLSAFGFSLNRGLRFNTQEAKLELKGKGIDAFGKNVMGFQEGDLLYKWQGEEIDVKTLKKTWEA